MRRSIWTEGIYEGSGNRHDMVKIPRALFERLTETVCYSGWMDKVKQKSKYSHI